MTILYLTDFYYKANGRNYYKEDLYLTGWLKEHFPLLIGHPQQALSFLTVADLVVFRNTGPVMWYKDYFSRFVQAVSDRGLRTFNSFDGKADTRGKDYLVQLTLEGYAVIPTVEGTGNIAALGHPEQYIIKQKHGADSIGMQVINREQWPIVQPSDLLVQPFLDFRYEVSFYYLDNRFQYALYAPDKQQRWALEEYPATAADLAFAETFIRWNNMARGIQRVDACRMPDGSLLLVELEDLNPYLSLDVLSPDKRESFVEAFILALETAGS